MTAFSITMIDIAGIGSCPDASPATVAGVFTSNNHARASGLQLFKNSRN